MFTSLESHAVTSLTLKDALSKVLSSGPEIKLNQYNYRASLGVLKSEESIFFPTFGVEGGYQKFDSDSEKISGNFGNIFGEYKFDLGGSNYFRYKAASTESEIAQLKYEQTQKQLQWAIETKFSYALYFQESIKFFKTALEQNVNFAQAAKKKRASGLASDADVIEFDLNESILKSDLEEIQSGFGESLNNLRVALGLDLSESFELNGVLEHYHIMESIEQLKGRLNKTNLKGQLIILESKRAGYLQTASYGSFLPEITLRATYGRRGMDEPPGPEQTYFVIARWELFSGFKDLGNYQKALALQQKAELEKNQSEINLPKELEVEFKKFIALQNRVDLESQNKERSKRYLNTVMSEYRRGVKNSADLKAASMQLLDASIRDLKYRYEGIKQKEVLQNLVGDTIHFEVYTTNHKIN